MKYKIPEFDFVFLSFDEPNAEHLYSKLVNIVPWCKRVHGIKGFDAAHKACAAISDTEFFITVDGDNLIYPQFLDQEIEITELQLDHAWAWAGRNHVNGLVYGNGGIKLWSKAFVNGMKSHEHAANLAASVDFCWTPGYNEVFGCYSTSVINGSSKQAWRAGFREGVKMSLDRGNRIDPAKFKSHLWEGNINRLCIWASIGLPLMLGRLWSSKE